MPTRPSKRSEPPPLAPIRLGPEIANDLAAAERREWWLANGRGGYAGGTVAGTLTRRYHGLLIAPIDPPLGRMLVLAKADATATVGGALLSALHQPLGKRRDRARGLPPDRELSRSTARSRSGGSAAASTVVEQRIWMEPGADTVYVALALRRRRRALSVCLLANGRDHHGDTWPDGFRPDIATHGTTLMVTAPGRFALTVAVAGGTAEARRDWYWDFALPVEHERGLGDRDAHLHVGDLSLALEPGKWAGFAAGVGDVSADLDAALRRRIAWDRVVVARAAAAEPAFAKAPDWVTRLILATDAFLVARPIAGAPEGKSVIAGYPWFGDWGRDTMISLPGLCLATGRAEDARTILETFARFVDGGMLPNVFPEGAADRPDYNTADATLWYLEAWRAYVAATGDEAALRAVFPTLAGIVAAHRQGTRYGIGVDPADGLLRAGEPGVQLDLDGRAGRRLGRDAADRQAGRDQRALVQRARRDGGAGRADRRKRGALPRGGGEGKGRVRAFRHAGRAGALRRARRAERP